MPTEHIHTPTDTARSADVPRATVAVPLGRPVAVLALRYTAMYGPKPFDEALLALLDNGTYKILSPGEDHHGCHVSATDPSGPLRHVAFMSWPSVDWDSNVAAHTLTFDGDTGAFIQELRLPGDPVPRAQHGFAVAVPDPARFDLEARWPALRSAHVDVFDRLRVLAAAPGRERTTD